jgi:hypothetical protein
LDFFYGGRSSRSCFIHLLTIEIGSNTQSKCVTEKLDNQNEITSIVFPLSLSLSLSLIRSLFHTCCLSLPLSQCLFVLWKKRQAGIWTVIEPKPYKSESLQQWKRLSR